MFSLVPAALSFLPFHAFPSSIPLSASCSFAKKRRAKTIQLGRGSTVSSHGVRGDQPVNPFISQRTYFLSFSFILIVYRVLEAFSLNATLIFTLINK